MSTRGLYGIRKDGVEKCTYNHFDSYPDGLGKDILEFCKANTIEKLSTFFDLITLIDNNVKPTDEQVKICVDAGYFDASVSEQSIYDWYCLLRNLQGNFDEYIKAIDNKTSIFMSDDSNFIYDSLSCEYAYIIDLDEETLDFYVGYQKTPDSNSRYGTKSHNGYYPCKLVTSFPLNQLCDIQKIIEIMQSGLDEDDYEIYQQLIDLDLSDDDATECINNDWANVIEKYDDLSELAEALLKNISNIPEDIINYIDLDSYGSDFVYDNSEEFKELSSGVVIKLG